jgi:hypothetical protein
MLLRMTLAFDNVPQSDVKSSSSSDKIAQKPLALQGERSVTVGTF